MKKINSIEISVVIAHRNNFQFISRCVKSIYQERGDIYEVVIVDDFSEGNRTTIFEKLRTQFTNLTIIYLPSFQGAAYARNMGVVNSKGEYIFFLDADTEILSEWRNEITKFFEKNEDAGCAQVQLLKSDKKHIDYGGDYVNQFFLLNERLGEMKDIKKINVQTPIFSGKSAGLIVKKSIFESVGGFDNDLQVFFEDTDLCWRIWLAGYKVYYIPSIRVIHHYVSKGKDHAYYVKNKVIMRGARNSISVMMKNKEFPSVILFSIFSVALWSTILFVSLITGNVYKASEIFKGIVFSIFSLPTILKKRRQIQAYRKMSDRSLFNQVGIHIPYQKLIHKGFAYIQGKPYYTQHV
ncbi:MAG: glycosyltransferase family 2 protein [bacterium]|nr:glycosyltransferase family 2 protein [bacterium]